MARKSQKLINYHTGGKTTMPASGDVQFGEIVVRHNQESPELLIKIPVGTQGETGYYEDFATFVDKGAVHSAITAAIITSEGETESELSKLKTAVSGIMETYAVSSITHTEIENARNNAVTSAYTAASGYTDNQITALSGAVVAAIEGVTSGDLTDLKSRVSDLEAFSGVVEANYATKEFVGAASGYAYNTAKSEVIGEATDGADADTVYGAKAYASSLTKSLSGDIITYVDGKNSSTDSKISTLSANVASTSAAVETLSGDVISYVDNRLVTVYKYKGTVADKTALDAIENPENGDVWNVIAAVGNPGEEGYVPAGTNFAWVEADEYATESEGRWDPLGGSVDVSSFATQSALTAVEGRVTSLESATGTLNTNINTVSGALETLSGKVVSDYATKTDVSTEVGAASAAAVTSAYTASTAYTDQQIAILSGISSAYTDTKVDDINSDINTVKSNYALSSVTHNEIEEAKATIIGSAVTTSADPETITGLKLYSDEKDRELQEEIETKMSSVSGAASGAVAALSGAVEAALNALDSRVSANENKFSDSAATWNNAIQGAEFGAVQSTDSHYSGGSGSGSTVDSNAKLMYTEGGNVVIDLSELIIDCGDF